MFKKLVSNLPFSPSLVAQLGFYARRLKKEQWMRRLGVIFTVFALIIQSFAVFSPPESANAANATDVLSGGCQNKACFLSAWDTNRQGFRDLLTYMEITRDDLNAGTYDLTYASSWSYTFGRTDAYYRVGSITASGTNYYYGPLQWSGRDYALIGYSSKVGAFAILGPCGNLLLNKLPPASGCQSLEASVNSGPAEGVAGQTEYRFRPTGWYQNGGTIGDYYIEWSGPETGKSDWVGMSNWWYHKFGKPGIYKITAYVRGSSGTVTSAACSKTLTIKETPDPKYDLVKEVSAKTIQPGGTLNYTLTFKNLGNVALTNVIIKDALSPYVTLVGRPIVTPATTSSGDLFSIAGLKINSVAVGQTITIKYSVKVKSFEQLVCGQNQIVNQSSVKTDQKTDNGNNDETDPKNNDQTTTVEAVCEFEYDLEKTADKETAQPGDTIKYTLTFRNTGNRELTDVVIKDALPAGVALDGAATVSPADGSSGDLFSSSGLRLAKVAAGQDVVITYTVKVGNQANFQCGINKLPNQATATTREAKTESDTTNNEWIIDIDRHCDCSDPEIAAHSPECQNKKTAINNTQGGVDATTVKARGGDVITFTITTVNTGSQAETITIDDPLTDILEYANLTDHGGGTFNEETKTLSWQITLAPGATAIRSFSVTVKNPVPSMAQGTSLPASYDCLMSNVADNGVGSNGTNIINVPVYCPPPKVVENIVTELPATGPGTNIIFGGIVAAIVVFFYARSRQLGKEVRLVRREFNAGTL